MDKIASYRIIPELKLIIEVFGGKISITDAIELLMLRKISKLASKSDEES